ncbi:MAG: glucose-6-phosphate dehydrogenase, partial [Micrococcales bacterium]|nr:glucose-6-phosphate dehydrogenase [Micrococcales bacterium]
MTAPTTVVLFGATGDLAQRKLIPGLLHLFQSRLLDDLRVVGTSLDDKSVEEFRDFVHTAVREHSTRDIDEADWREFVQRVDYVPLSSGPEALARAVAAAEEQLPGDVALRLHYLAVPPKAALAAVQTIADAKLVERSRVVMEKPFGHDHASAVALNAELHQVFDEEQIFRIDHFLGKEPAQNILAFRFANGLFEPIWHRNNISHVQIDVPETLGLSQRADFYEATGAYRDMVVTHLFQILAFTAMEPPTALEPAAISREKNKVFRSMQPIMPTDVVRGQYTGYHDEPGVAPDSDTETFVALKCFVDNWRWAGVPFYLRTGKRMAEGARIISIAFKEPPQSMFPKGSGVGDQGPDHLTFDLADKSRMSLSFYGKRPGPGFRLDKLSMQFAMQETDWAGAVLEAYERLIYDAARGDRTLFTSATGIERLWEISQPILDNPPPVHPYAQGTYGPNQIHQLIAPFTWRLPFERKWR